MLIDELDRELDIDLEHVDVTGFSNLVPARRSGHLLRWGYLARRYPFGAILRYQWS